MNLRDRAVSGVKWTGVSTVLKSLLQLGQMALMAKYFLEQKEIGLMAIVMVVIQFSNNFVDMGISNAIIHKQQISKDQLSSLYWMNIFSGLLLFLIIYFVTPLIANFYNEEILKELIFVVSFSFIIIPFGQQSMILLQKELKFNIIAKIEILAIISGFIISIISAIKGFGIYSIIFGLLLENLIKSCLFFIKGFQYHKPKFIFNFKEISEFINFGFYQMGEKIINYLNTQFDTIIIGKLLGAESLGIYTIAKTLVMKPAMIVNPVITKIAFPVMAKCQNDVEKLKAIYLKTMNLITSVNAPVYIAIMVLAEQLVIVLFGERWLKAIPILQILAVFGLIRSTANPVGSLLLAKGKADTGFYWSLALFIFIPITVYFGAKNGLTEVALAILVLQGGLFVPGWYFLVRKNCNATFSEYLTSITKPCIAATLSGLVSLFFKSFLSNETLILIVITAVGGASYLIFSLLVNRSFIKDLKNYKSN